MVRSSKSFSSAELETVLKHYDIGAIGRIYPLAAGNAHAPKAVITSENGTFLLKRRPHGKDDSFRAAYSHKVQKLLATREFPLAPLMPTRTGQTMLRLDSHLYELFEFVTGTRYDGSAEAIVDAGRQLACFHAAVKDCDDQKAAMTAIYHDSAVIRRNITIIASGRRFEHSAEIAKLGVSFGKLYENSSLNVSRCGFEKWPQQMIHGDWHPGNLLFSHQRVSAVLDFDSMKSAPVAADIANGILHFSMVAGRPNPAQWPEYLDQAKLAQFLGGYKQAGTVGKEQVRSLLDLMIEALIAEAVLPVAATGKFGNLAGLDFLKMIYRKCRWIDKNRKKLNDAIDI